jgi:hypothetical protein
MSTSGAIADDHNKSLLISSSSSDFFSSRPLRECDAYMDSYNGFEK